MDIDQKRRTAEAGRVARRRRTPEPREARACGRESGLLSAIPGAKPKNSVRARRAACQTFPAAAADFFSPLARIVFLPVCTGFSHRRALLPMCRTRRTSARATRKEGGREGGGGYKKFWDGVDGRTGRASFYLNVFARLLRL